MRATHLAGWCIGILLSAGSLWAAADLRLIEAVRSGNKTAVRALLKQGVDVNAPQGDGATPLHWAAYADDLEMVDLLIRAGAKVNAANDVGATPLWLASNNGGAAVVDRLLTARANPNAALDSGETPLMAASRTGSADAVRALLVHGARTDARESWRGQTALMWAVSQKHPDVVQALIAGGADVRARTKTWWELVNPTGTEDGTGVEWVQQGGFTPLLFAAREGDLESAKRLLAAGADVNDTAASGTSAVVIATQAGNGALAALLLEDKADPNAAAAGYSALHLAILRDDMELVKQLMAHGANPNVPVERPTAARRSTTDLVLRPAVVGATPFWMAARFGQAQTMKLLASYGADPLFVKASSVPAVVQAAEVSQRPVPEPAGMTTLMAALASENIRRRSLPAGVPDAEERTVLDTVKLTVDLGVNVNAADEDGDTALHRAARLRFNSVVQFLADRGARLEVKNGRGETPLMVASAGGAGRRGGGGGAAAGRISTADLLRRLGAKE